MLADAIGLPYRAAKRIRLSGFDEALVTGLGPIGATAAAVCRMAGARVIAVEPSPYRRDLGAKLAVEETFAPGPEVVDAVRDRTGGRMLTAALECSGTEDGLNRCISCLGVHGRLGILGENSRATINPSDAFIRRELTAAGVWYYGAGDFEDMVDLVRRGLPTDALITHRFPLEQAQEAYELMDQKQTGKVIFTRE
jgi:propanol-preferring alcohol dehydrogenase